MCVEEFQFRSRELLKMLASFVKYSFQGVYTFVCENIAALSCVFEWCYTVELRLKCGKYEKMY